jgi:hypothetical protein
MGSSPATPRKLKSIRLTRVHTELAAIGQTAVHGRSRRRGCDCRSGAPRVEEHRSTSQIWHERDAHAKSAPPASPPTIIFSDHLRNPDRDHDATHATEGAESAVLVAAARADIAGYRCHNRRRWTRLADLVGEFSPTAGWLPLWQWAVCGRGLRAHRAGHRALRIGGWSSPSAKSAMRA